MEPFEVVAAPLTVWVAPVGTAFPDVDEEPSGTWFKLGTSGDKNYADDGVNVVHNQTITEWVSAGSTMARKVWRTAEGFMLSFGLVDISVPQYAKALNNNDVVQVAAGSGTPGTDEIALYLGIEVTSYALLARGISPSDESMSAQFELLRAYQSAEPSPVFNKGAPATLQMAYKALFDEDAGGIGSYVVQTAVAS